MCFGGIVTCNDAILGYNDALLLCYGGIFTCNDALYISNYALYAGVMLHKDIPIIHVVTMQKSRWC